jgi:hypothetical protein
MQAFQLYRGRLCFQVLWYGLHDFWLLLEMDDVITLLELPCLTAECTRVSDCRDESLESA